MIRWFAHNPVAANLLMIAILLGGFLTIMFGKIPVEFFPEYEYETVRITTSLRGATPSSLEDGVTLRVEDAIQDLDGIKKIVSRSSEGRSVVNAEVEKGFDSRELLNDIKLRIDGISGLPKSAERPVIDIPKSVRNVISVVVAGNRSEVELQRQAQILRDKMLLLDGVSEIQFDSEREYEITITLDPNALKSLSLSLNDVSQAINANSLDLSAGNIKSIQGEVLVRTSAQAYSLDDYQSIPVVSKNNGGIIRLGDIATITDGFDDNKSKTRFNGKPASMLEVYRGDGESSLKISKKIREFVEEEAVNLPYGTELKVWRDRSRPLSLRLGGLLNGAVIGSILVIILLTLFLRPSVAAWVCLGIPVSFMGAVMLMPLTGATFNMISIFAFILALGIVVDDAIVTGENVYRHMGKGKKPLDAAIEGTQEVAVPVTFGVITTMVAFAALFMVDGRRGAMFAQIPMIVIPILFFSLIESKLILPAHLRFSKPIKKNAKQNFLSRSQQKISKGFETFVTKFYQPFLKQCISNLTITFVAFTILMIVVISSISNGFIKTGFFPRVASEYVSASLTMPSQTAYEQTDAHINTIAEAARALQDKYIDKDTGESVITNVLATTGIQGRNSSPNVGRVRFEITPPEERSIKIGSRQLAREWRRTIGRIPGAEKLSFRSQIGRSGEPVDIILRSNDLEVIAQVKDELRERLASLDGLFDIQDNLSGGKDEFQISLKPNAYQLGISLAEIGKQTRSAFFGLETQRIQRGRDEVRVMLRLPIESRSSVDSLYSLPILLPNKQTVRLSEVATITPSNSPVTLYRTDRYRTINVTADAGPDVNLDTVKDDLTTFLDNVSTRYPDLTYQLEGESKEQKEANSSMLLGLLFVLLAIYVLLAIPFRSYGLPLVVISIIPVGWVCGVLGHYVFNMFVSDSFAVKLSIMSFMGLLALTGVVVNDSLVLVDYINKQRLRGVDLMTAVMNAGGKRFRPVMLTSLTTFFGVIPLMMDMSTQAKFIKPMAISLGFGILFATFVTLLLIPVMYVIYERLVEGLAWIGRRLFLKRVSPAKS